MRRDADGLHAVRKYLLSALYECALFCTARACWQGWAVRAMLVRRASTNARIVSRSSQAAGERAAIISGRTIASFAPAHRSYQHTSDKIAATHSDDLYSLISSLTVAGCIDRSQERQLKDRVAHGDKTLTLAALDYADNNDVRAFCHQLDIGEPKNSNAPLFKPTPPPSLQQHVSTASMGKVVSPRFSERVYARASRPGGLYSKPWKDTLQRWEEEQSGEMRVDHSMWRGVAPRVRQNIRDSCSDSG